MGVNTLIGDHIYLRALEPEDIEVLYAIENDERFWNVGESITPFSRYVLKEYLSQAHIDIFESKQLRLVICEKTGDAVVGMIDLFDFDPHNLRAGVGIIIASEEVRGKGIGFEALTMVQNYAAKHLKLHQLYANIEDSNTASISLFEKAGFQLIGLKRDWRRKRSLNGTEHYTNEFLYQYLF